MPNPLTPSLIDTHERLYPRLAALLKQLERIAAKRPRDMVPEATLQLAGRLCRQAAALIGKDGRSIIAALGAAKGPRAVPLDHAGLVVVLGQAVAGLEAFEAAHSAPIDGVMCWQLGTGESRPVARLRARSGTASQKQAGTKPQAARAGYSETPSKMRQVVLKRIIERENERYMQGYRDAKAGRPPIAPITEIDAVPHGGGYVPHRRGGEGYPPLPPADNPDWWAAR